MNEKSYQYYYNQYRRKPVAKIEDLLKDLQNEMEEIGNDPTSERFIDINKSDYKLKLIVWKDLLEKKRR